MAALADRILHEAQALAEDDVAINGAIARHGSTVVPPGANILHHCNTGALATVDIGTALGVIYQCHKEGKGIHVWVDETRPRLQGARLTAWELMRGGVPMHLIADSAAGYLMMHGKVDVVLFGADRVAANGDVANKIGTYKVRRAGLSPRIRHGGAHPVWCARVFSWPRGLWREWHRPSATIDTHPRTHLHAPPLSQVCVVARENGVATYACVPTSTIDLTIATGDAIPIEERSASEVTTIDGAVVAPVGVPVFNPAFDVTPHKYLTGIITEEGICYPPFSVSLRKAKEAAEARIAARRADKMAELAAAVGGSGAAGAVAGAGASGKA